MLQQEGLRWKGELSDSWKGGKMRGSGLSHLIEQIVRGANALAMATIFLIMILGIADIALRLLGFSLPAIPNLSEFLLVGCIYLAVSYTQQKKGHVSVELVAALILARSERLGRLQSIVSYCISLVMCGILILPSWKYALYSFEIREKMSGEPFYPIYPAKIAIAVGLTLFLLQLFVHLAAEVRLYAGKSRGVKKARTAIPEQS